MEQDTAIRNRINIQGKMLLFTILLGSFTGLVIWCFLKAVSLGTLLVWKTLPGHSGFSWLPIPLCTFGGLLMGLLHRFFGDYPEELSVVMEKSKKQKHYDYHPMPVMLACAFLPLVFGASVGPEAGLTGIITALCYWVGDNVTYAKNHADTYSMIGEAVTLGQLFHSPLFGILAVEEDGDSGDVISLPRSAKLVYYGLSSAACFLIIWLLNQLLGKAMSGFPSFENVSIAARDYVLMVLYIPAGIIAWLFFEYAEKITGAIGTRTPAVLKEMICGLGIGITAILLPMVLFSGEEQMAELMDHFDGYAPLFLAGICFLKLFMTAFCIRLGMKGGHFFPLIFSCVCLGFALAMITNTNPAAHTVFAAGIVTSVTLGAQLRKPLAVSLLMLLCFPARMLFWVFLSAATGSWIAGRITGRISRK